MVELVATFPKPKTKNEICMMVDWKRCQEHFEYLHLQCKCLQAGHLYVLYSHARLSPFVLWLPKFSLSRVFHDGPVLSHPIWDLHTEKYDCSSLISKSFLIPFLLIDHSNSFPCSLLQSPHGFREVSVKQDLPPSAIKSILCSACSFSLWSLWLAFCLNITAPLQYLTSVQNTIISLFFVYFSPKTSSNVCE